MDVATLAKVGFFYLGLALDTFLADL